METLPADQYGNTQSNTVTLSTTTPAKAGYTFGGWCTVSPTITANGTTCPSGADTYQPGDTVTLYGTTSNDMELFAIWSAVTFDKAFSDAGKTKVGSYYAMQDMTNSICYAVAMGQESILVDNRADKKTYKVGRLKDGECWMLDNLALGGSSTITLKTTDTNIAADWTLPAAVTSGFNSYTTAKLITAYNNTIPTDALSTAGQWKVGTFYNYCAVTAGTYCPASAIYAETVNHYNICPKGWTVPSRESYRMAYKYYGSTNTYRSAMHIPLSGALDSNGNIANLSAAHSSWTTDMATANRVFNLYITPGGQVTWWNHGSRVEGATVRCKTEILF